MIYQALCRHCRKNLNPQTAKSYGGDNGIKKKKLYVEFSIVPSLSYDIFNSLSPVFFSPISLFNLLFSFHLCFLTRDIPFLFSSIFSPSPPYLYLPFLSPVLSASFASFRTFSLSLIFYSLRTKCPGVVFLAFILLGVL